MFDRCATPGLCGFVVYDVKQFERIFRTFASVGLNVVPSRPDGKWPACRWAGLAEPGSPRVDDALLLEGAWAAHEGPLWAFLFPASAAKGYRPLVVVDVDAVAWLGRAVATFGESPLVVRTRRGFHLYYRAPDDGREVISRSAIFGEPGVDIKAWRAGVMAPGSPNPKGGTYQPSVPLESITREFIETLPFFDLDTYQRVWTENRPKSRKREQDYARRNPDQFRSVKDKPKTMAGGLEVLGDVKGNVEVVVESTGERMPLSKVSPGEKVFAFNREDVHASGQVWKNASGQLFYTDWSQNFMWRIVPDDWLPFYAKVQKRPPDRQAEHSELASAVKRAHSDVEVLDIENSGYLNVDVPEGATLVRAPHGCGKTELAKRLFARAQRAITVANTRMLVTANAERFEVPSHLTENSKVSPKVSTTINSILKFDVDASLDVFHIDEADQVLGFLHSEKVKNRHACFLRMMDLAAQSHRTLITSADLTFEHIDLFVQCIRSRNPQKPIRVVVREP